MHYETKQTLEKETLMICFQNLIDLINKKTCDNCRLFRGRNCQHSMGQKPAEETEEVKRQNNFFQTLDSP